MNKGLPRASKRGLLSTLASQTQISRVVADGLLSEFSITALNELKRCGVFDFPGVGRLKLERRKDRVGRNPKTGQPVRIPSRPQIKFIATRDFLNATLSEEERAAKVREVQARLDADEIQVLKGRPIWLESIEDCELVQRVCVLPDAWGILDKLAKGSLNINHLAYLKEERFAALSTINSTFDQLIFDMQSPHADPYSVDDIFKELDGPGSMLLLRTALDIVRDVWRREERKQDLRAVLTLPDKAGGQVGISAADAVWLLQPGSLESLIWTGAYFSSKWIVGTTLRHGRVPSQIAEDIIENLRNRRSAGPKLQTLREMTPADFDNAQSVFICLHGLMSVDVGLFDQLINELRKQPEFKTGCLFLAFPHDTFASIDSNSTSLLQQIEHLFENNITARLAFLCHSRGGLLAREVATRLYQSSPDVWRDRLVACVTFGTPHQGTPIAEKPEALLGAGVAAVRMTQPGAFMGAFDVLALVSAYKGNIPGIKDLKPPSSVNERPATKAFVEQLWSKEYDIAHRQHCRLEVLAIGGEGPHENRVVWFSDKVFRGAKNDCAVPLSSSAPKNVSGFRYKDVNSDHFSYFTGYKGFTEAIDFLKERLPIPEVRVDTKSAVKTMRLPPFSKGAGKT